jgi:hypothetical protein
MACSMTALSLYFAVAFFKCLVAFAELNMLCFIVRYIFFC